MTLGCLFDAIMSVFFTSFSAKCFDVNVVGRTEQDISRPKMWIFQNYIDKIKHIEV